jgi:hypothetical protein
MFKKVNVTNDHCFAHRIVSTHSHTIGSSGDIVSTVSDTPSTSEEKNVEKEEQPRPKIGVFVGKRDE